MDLVKLKTFENNELIVPVIAAWVSRQVAHYRKENGRIESFIALIHVVGQDGRLAVFPPHAYNLKALRFLLERVNLNDAI